MNRACDIVIMEKYMSNSEYESRVALAFESKSDIPCPNGYPEHARVIIKHMLLSSTNEVNLYSGQLALSIDSNDDQSNDTEIYGWRDVIRAVGVFLAKQSAKLSIIVDDASLVSSDKHPLIKQYGHLDNFNIKQLPSNKKSNHFMTSDGKAYRFEYDHDRSSAVACANDPEVASRLNKQFQHLFDVAVPIK